LTVIRNQQYQDTITDNEMISSISIAPGIENIKNDYVVYGEAENKIPVHLRYVLQEKPTRYTPIRLNNPKTYTTDMGLLLEELNNLPEDLTLISLGVNGKIYQEGSLEYIYLEKIEGENISNHFKSGKHLQITSNASDEKPVVTILNVVVVDNIISKNNEEKWDKPKTIQSSNNIKVYITPSGLSGSEYSWNVFELNDYESKY
jgi:hypothetical protein